MTDDTVGTIDTTSAAESDGAGRTTSSDRRALFGRGAAAAAAATIAGLAFGRTAEAANGDNVRVGFTTTGTSNTTLSGGTSFRVVAGSSDSVGGRSVAIFGSQTSYSGVAVYGREDGSSGGSGVVGSSSSFSGTGVEGVATGPFATGVYGLDNAGSSGPGVGVSGESSFGVGVRADGFTADYVAAGSGKLQLLTAGQSGSPTATGSIGTIARDSAGNLWYAYATNKWRKIAGTGTGGAFHPVDPARVYDSRWPGEAGKFNDGSRRNISVANARNLNGGAISVANFVPAGATAVTGNLTVAGTEGSAGGIAVMPGGASAYRVSNLSWQGSGRLIANSFTATLNTNRQLRIFCFGNRTHVVIDITGYYL
jgi:hypothetical protein